MEGWDVMNEWEDTDAIVESDARKANPRYAAWELERALVDVNVMLYDLQASLYTPEDPALADFVYSFTDVIREAIQPLHDKLDELGLLDED